MINAAFKRSLILVVLTFGILFHSFGQKKGRLKEFSKEFPDFIIELNEFMTASDNAELKLVFKL